MTRRRAHPFLVHSTAAALAALVVVFGALLGLLAASNELHSFAAVTETEEDLLWGPAFGQFNAAYKLARARYLEPDVLVLGSSRVTQFRDVMTPGARFYTAGGAAGSFGEAHAFLRALYRWHRPGVVMLGIDAWWFAPERGGGGCEVEGGPCLRHTLRQLLGNALAKGTDPKFLGTLFASHLSGDFRFGADPAAGRKPIGFRASLRGDGYRPDGSYQYGALLIGRDPYYDLQRFGYANGFAYFLSSVHRHRGRFQYTGKLAPGALDVLRRILALNHANGVNTILFLPPFASAIYQALRADARQAAYIQGVEDAVEKAAVAAGVEFFNFHDLAWLVPDDEHTKDGIHADEIGYLVLTDRIAREGRILRQYVDITALAALTERVVHNGDHLDRGRIVR